MSRTAWRTAARRVAPRILARVMSVHSWILLLGLVLSGCSDEESAESSPPTCDEQEIVDAESQEEFWRRWDAAEILAEEHPELPAILAALAKRFPFDGDLQREVRVRRESPTVVLVEMLTWSPDTSVFQAAALERNSGRWTVEEPAMPRTIACAFGPPATAVEVGSRMFESLRCGLCHPGGRESAAGPSLFGLFGRERRLSDGTVVVADEEYIRTILFARERPSVEGWGRTMPIYPDRFWRPDVDALIAYLKTLE